jgi:hypothetical protein
MLKINEPKVIYCKNDLSKVADPQTPSLFYKGSRLPVPTSSAGFGTLTVSRSECLPTEKDLSPTPPAAGEYYLHLWISVNEAFMPILPNWLSVALQ